MCMRNDISVFDFITFKIECHVNKNLYDSGNIKLIYAIAKNFTQTSGSIIKV